MISHSESFSTFTVSLAQSTHRLAEQFCQHHTDWQKAEQVYLNTLAVYAVDYYLNCLGYETDRQHSGSHNVVIQSLLDVADLIVKDYGRLECRPISTDTKTVYIPQEVWHDRLGYVAVAFNDALDEAEILGFFQQVEAIEVPLSQLQPLDNLSDYLSSHRYPTADHAQSDQAEPNQAQLTTDIQRRTLLGEWLKNIFSNGWASLEERMAVGQPQFAFQFRSLHSNQQEDKSSTSVTRTKLVKLGSPEHTVLMLVTLTPEPDTSAQVQIEILPTSEHPFLPTGLQLSILDEREEIVMQAKTQETNDGIRLEFTADLGNRFSIKISLDNAAITEGFLL